MKSMIQKTLSAAAVALAFGFGFATTGWADFAKTNPVTGATENYTWKFVGTDTWNGTQYWQDSTAANPSAVPAKSESNIWAPILFDGSTININAGMRVEGWALRMGLFNGARITLNNLRKLQNSGSDMWITVDSSSKFAVGSTGFKESDSEAKGGAIGENGVNINFYVASENGIDFQDSFDTISDQGATVNYYLTGAGSVQYAAISAANHKIKQADVTLSDVTASKMVRSRTLVSFTSSTKTFTADATIKVKNSDGTANRDVALSSVTATTSTLTTSGNVGDCELVQTSTGVVLYYVDYAKTYKNSININFTSGTALSTSGDVGLTGYAIPGTSWNNLTVANNATLSALNAAYSSGATYATAASVTLTGTRGYHSCSALTAASDLRHGYIDENAGNPTPTITVSGIPYEKYRVIVYTATDTPSTAFGYITVNGKNYTYVNDALAEDTTAWGASGAQDTAEPMAEGVNVLVSPVTLGSTLTVVGHRGTGARGCIAAVQIVEYVPEVTENDLVIPVTSASVTYTVSEAKTYGTVYVVGSGTLTLDGSAKITASTIDVAKDVVLNINADRLDATTFAGSGTVVYDGSQPSTTKGFDNSSGWAGTVWVKNIGDTSRGEATSLKVNTCLGSNTAVASDNDLNKWGNANSFVKFTNVRAYMAAANVLWTLILEDDSTNYAWYNNEGWTARTITIAGLKGSGTFWDINDSDCRPFLNFTDASQFSGSIKALGKQVFLNGAGSGDASSLSGGRIVVPANQVFTVAADKTWHTRNGLVVDGILNVNGTLGSESSSSAVSGSGTVVFTGREPTPTGAAWWKNDAWTGTVEIKNATLAKNIHLADYGNTGSKVCMNGSSAYLYVQSTGNHNIGELIIGSDGFTQGGSYSSGTVSIVLPCKVTGTGTYSLTAGGGASKTVSLTGDLSEFDGALSATGNNCRFVVGSTTRTFATGSIVVGSDKVLKIAKNINPTGGLFVDEGGRAVISGDGFVWTSAGITADGVVSVTSLAGNIGGGTAVTVGDAGVFEVTRSDSSGNDDGGTDYSRVTGTGIIRFAGEGFTVISQSIPTSLKFAAEKTSGSVVPVAGATIGSLTGSKGFRSDWGNNSESGRYLTIKQSKDTVWEGSINADGTHRLTGVVVDPGESTTGTLTLTATQTASSTLTVNGAVNLTGTWVGATTVAGTFGGTGTLTGNLTFSDGATFKAFASDENGLSVSGSVTTPGSGSVAVDVSDIASSITSSGVTLISGGDLEVGTFAAPSGYRLVVEDSALKVKLIPVTLTPAAPVFQDYTNATIVATVSAEGPFDAAAATYTATVGNQSYDGKYENGSVTFEIPGSAGDSANVTLTATLQAGGAAVATVNTSFVFGSAADWFEETAAKFGDSGTWVNATTNTTADKIVLSGDANATFTPTKKMTGNTADVVWVVSFDAPNDDDLSEELVGAQTAFRLATGGFQLWVTNGSSGAWVDVAATGIEPAINTEYTITNHFDYSDSAHTLTVTVNGVPLTADNGTTTTFALPSGKTKVDSFEFAGAGALTGIAGNFINTMLYVDGDGNAYATLAEIPSGQPVTALTPTNMILTVEPGLALTVPTGMPAANIKPTYHGASISGYVDVSIVNGKVTLSATEAAKPSATAMTAEGIAVGNVKPGLFYWVEASTMQDFATKTNGTPVQATSDAALSVAPANPEGKVIFYRVAVDAEKPATP